MSLPTFPSLPGQGWSVHKKPTFSTRVAPHSSGREVRVGLYAHALYEFEMTFNGLDSSGGFPGLQANSLQTLMGFFLSIGGQLNTFLYSDPSDNSAAMQGFGVGDGVTTTFTLGRAIGGYFEPVSYVIAPTAPTVGPSGGYLPNNLVSNSMNVGVVTGLAFNSSGAYTGPGALPTGWMMFADSGLVVTVVGTGTQNGLPYIDLQFAGTATNSYLVLSLAGIVTASPGQTHIASFTASLTGGTLANVNCVIEVRTNNNTNDVAFTPTATPTLVSSTFTLPAGSTQAEACLLLTLTTGAAVNLTLRLAGVMQSQVNSTLQTAPFSFIPTYGAANYGAPQIFVNGAPAASAPTFTAPNSVTFSTPPSNGAVLAWTGSYAFQCRLLDDQWDFEEFMSGLWANKSVKFRSSR